MTFDLRFVLEFEASECWLYALIDARTCPHRWSNLVWSLHLAGLSDAKIYEVRHIVVNLLNCSRDLVTECQVGNHVVRTLRTRGYRQRLATMFMRHCNHLLNLFQGNARRGPDDKTLVRKQRARQM